MKVLQTGIFSRRIKKLHPLEKDALDEAVRAIMDNPALGQMKKGDLAGVQVTKYKHQMEQILLAYRFSNADDPLMLLALGTHENFYRDLKRQ